MYPRSLSCKFLEETWPREQVTRRQGYFVVLTWKGTTPRDMCRAVPRKCVTCNGQRSSPWSCNSVEIKFHLECKPRFPCAQLMLQKCTNLSVSNEANYWVSWLALTPNEREYELWKKALNSSFCSVIANSKSRWPHGRKSTVSCRTWYKTSSLHQFTAAYTPSLSPTCCEDVVSSSTISMVQSPNSWSSLDSLLIGRRKLREH